MILSEQGLVAHQNLQVHLSNEVCLVSEMQLPAIIVAAVYDYKDPTVAFWLKVLYDPMSTQ